MGCPELVSSSSRPPAICRIIPSGRPVRSLIMRSIRASTCNIQTAVGIRLFSENSQFPRVACIFRPEGAVEHLPPEELSPMELFQYLRELAKSRNIAERLRTLWIVALFGERLERCSDGQIGDLLSKVQERMGLFSPEFSVCEHAKRRLQRSLFKMNTIFRRFLK
jgi:hypothetical protein